MSKAPKQLLEELRRLEKERDKINHKISYRREVLSKFYMRNSHTDSHTDSHISPSPLVSPDEKESSKGKVNPSIIPPTETTTTTRACACEGENHTTGPKAQKPKDAEPRERMKTPSIEECREYHAAKKYSWEIESFYDYYTANGWKVGRNPMKDWRAAMRNWNRTEAKYSAKPSRAISSRGTRRASNWVGATEKQIRDFSNAFKRKH